MSLCLWRLERAHRIGPNVHELGIGGQKWALQVVDAVVERTSWLLQGGGFESDACCSERLRKKLGSGERDL